MNIASFIGNLGTDVELRDAGETKVASFGVVVNRPLSKDKREELEAAGKPVADFIPVETWGPQAESCAKYLAKGKKVGITGRLKSRRWTTDDGQNRFALEIVAERVEFLSPANGNGNGGATAQAEAAASTAENDDIPF